MTWEPVEDESKIEIEKSKVMSEADKGHDESVTSS